MKPSATALFLSTWTLASAAWGINQPRGGPRIPVGSELQSLFTSRSEMLSVQDDAAIQPERFVPGCRLTFTLVTRANAAFRNVFGWYNVRPGVVPTPATAPRDLHVLIPCDAQAGQAFTLDLRNNPDYAGGEIGFFLRTPEDGTTGRCSGDCCASLSRTGHTYYSERGYNPDAMGADSYIHLLIYDSRARARAFYFAWEDLYGGGDNNFTDFVASVDQIVCTGAGAACDTGRPGACAQGSLQCRNGALACLGAVTPQTERCDGIDNDCNGMVDEGDGLCGARMVCDRGVCVDRCMGELGCFEGFVCSERGTCVEAACATVSCGAGQRCAAGACVGACDALSCPRGQTCRAGRCVDPCEGTMCDSDQVCVAGNCVPRCECARCAAGQRCGSDGRCVAEACATVSCAAGQVCQEGQCRDACEGARCPAGERCEVGRCVPAPPADSGVRDGAIEVGLVDLGTDLGVDTGVDAGVDAGERLTVAPDDRGGCACRAAGAPGRGRAGVAGGVLALGALGVLRRRRRGASHPVPGGHSARRT